MKAKAFARAPQTAHIHMGVVPVGAGELLPHDLPISGDYCARRDRLGVSVGAFPPFVAPATNNSAVDGNRMSGARR